MAVDAAPLSELLQQLRDIHSPVPPSAWPPAPGWWILAGMLIALIAAGIEFWRRHWFAQQPLRMAVKMLEQAYALQGAGDTTVAYLDRVGSIVRRVLRLTRPHQVGTTGHAYAELLGQSAPNLARALSEDRFRSYSLQENLDLVHQEAVEFVRAEFNRRTHQPAAQPDFTR